MAHTGGIVWDASRALADYIDTLFGSQPTRMEGLRVLELGAGVSAFPSQICAHLGAEVTATDHEQIELLEQNMTKVVCDGRSGPRVQQLDWASHVALESIVASRYDIVLFADVLYEQTWRDVLQLVVALLHRDRHVTVYMCNTNRKAVHLFHRKLVPALGQEFVVERIVSPVLDATHVLWKIAVRDACGV
jgi:predicted nicotinamide N-methyase